ncbi:MAG: helix-turn-helix domain-containing protein [Ignisphaera sp.]
MNLNRYSEDEVDNEFIEFVAPIATRHSSSDEAVESIASDRGPRSRVVEAILLLLYVKPMKSSEIAKILNKSSKLISSYLSYWKTRRYVVYRTGYWMLTKLGEEHVKTLLESIGVPIATPRDVVLLAHKLINEQIHTTINNKNKLKNTPYSTEIQQFIVSETAKNVGKHSHNTSTDTKTTLEKALSCVKKVLETKDLLEEEITILNYLIKHYVEWSSTYLYLDQIADELHYPSHELMNILRKLQTKKLVYLYTDRRFGIRVGLGKSFKYILDQCMSKTV